MPSQVENFNKSADLLKETLIRDAEALSPKSHERLTAFDVGKEDEDRAFREKRDRDRAQHVTEGCNRHEVTPELQPGQGVQYPKVSEAQVEAFFEKMEKLGIRHAVDVQPENLVERIIQHSWHQVETWERQQDEQRAERRFEDTRAFVDKLMTLDEFNREAKGPSGPHEGRTL